VESAARTRRSETAIRIFDICVAAVLLALLAPTLMIVAAAIAIESPGGAIYRCRRIGRGGKPFDMLKFRKMPVDACGPALTIAGDGRFTRVGEVLARLKLDELPQLWNVLRGDMSLVGPRPEDPEFVELFPDEFSVILTIPPGVTGLSQLAYAREGEILDPTDRAADYMARVLPQKLMLDKLYAERRDPDRNLQILFWTASAVMLRRAVSVNRETGALTLRRRPAAAARDASTTTADVAVLTVDR
jgi:lipopolysaccharide/colanic/teichoic acid biosynthesis glycosyltransferase